MALDSRVLSKFVANAATWWQQKCSCPLLVTNLGTTFKAPTVCSAVAWWEENVRGRDVTKEGFKTELLHLRRGDVQK